MDELKVCMNLTKQLRHLFHTRLNECRAGAFARRVTVRVTTARLAHRRLTLLQPLFLFFGKGSLLCSLVALLTHRRFSGSRRTFHLHMVCVEQSISAAITACVVICHDGSSGSGVR